MCGQLEPGKEGNLAIRGTFSIEQAFRLVAGHDALGGDDLDAILGVPVGCGTVMVTAGLPGGCTTCWAAGRAMGRTMGCAMAGALAAVSAESSGWSGILSVCSDFSGGCGHLMAWSLFAGQSSSPLFAECSKVV